MMPGVKRSQVRILSSRPERPGRAEDLPSGAWSHLAAFEVRWNRWNVARTLTSVCAVACVAGAG